jgi:hypothetical protein
LEDARPAARLGQLPSVGDRLPNISAHVPSDVGTGIVATVYRVIPHDTTGVTVVAVHAMPLISAHIATAGHYRRTMPPTPRTADAVAAWRSSWLDPTSTP